MMRTLDNRFDKHIKDALGKFRAPLDEGSWDLLQRRMNAGGDDVDKLAQSALTDLRVPLDASNWDLLQQKMALNAQEEIDQLAKTALKDYQVPYDFSSWQLLKARLDRIDDKRKVIAMKVMEAAVILFALLTFVKFLGPIPESDTTTITPAFAESSQEKPISDPDTDLSDLGTNLPEGSRVLQSFGKQSDAASKHNPESDETGVKAAGPASESESVSQAGEELLINTDFTNGRRHNTETVSIEGKAHLLPEKKPHLRGLEKTSAFRTVPTLAYQSLASSVEPIHYAFQPIKVKRKSIISTSLSAYAPVNSYKIDNFNSRREVVHQEKSNMGIGVGAIVSFGKIGFDLGLAYDHFSYHAFSSSSEVKQVQIPIHLRYSVISQDFVEFYVKGGMVYNGIMKAHYAPLLATSRTAQPSDEPYYSSGLLEGGYKEFNTYKQISLGAGLAVHLDNNWSLFVERLYQDHYRGSIGNTSAKISTISTKVGLNYTF